nr:MAG TPA: hypothetical protein [Caudoviricetes sp.]
MRCRHSIPAIFILSSGFKKKIFFLASVYADAFFIIKVVEESINLILYFFIYTSAIQRSKHIKKRTRATRRAPHLRV